MSVSACMDNASPLFLRAVHQLLSVHAAELGGKSAASPAPLRHPVSTPRPVEEWDGKLSMPSTPRGPAPRRSSEQSWELHIPLSSRLSPRAEACNFCIPPQPAAQKAMTFPSMTGSLHGYKDVMEEAPSHLHGDGSARKNTATSGIDGEIFSFNWLLAELADAHERELRQALKTGSLPHLPQAQALVPLGSNPPQASPEKAADAICARSPESSSTAAFLHGANSHYNQSSLTCSEEPTSPKEPTSPFYVSGSSGRISRSSMLNLTKQQKGQTHGGQSRFARLSRLLHGEEFEVAIALTIMLNALIMCCECQFVGLDVGFNLQYPGRTVKASVVWPGAQTALTLFDWFFGLLFFLEMLVKLICWHVKYFYDSEKWNPDKYGWDLRDWKVPFARFWQSLQGWNVLDFFCVATFLFDKMATSSSVVNPQMFRLLRLVRLFRIIRLLRFLETLDHLYVMTTAIAGLSKVLAWAIILLTIMLLTCDLFLVQMLQVTYFDQITVSDLTDDQLKRHHQMYAYFGTCSRCMLSMFEMTLGNWPPVARLLSEEVSEWFTLICLVHKLTIGFAVVGVITGIILQETFKVAQTDDIIMFRQKKKASSILGGKMQALFSSLDKEGDGKLSVSEFTSIGENPEIRTWLASLDIETDDLKTLFELIDVDGGGYITIDELVSRMPRIKGAARSIDVLALRRKLDDHKS